MIRIIALSILLLFGADAMAKPSRVREADRHEQKLPAIPQPASAPDTCRPTSWKSVSRDTVKQAAELIKQYDAASDQLAKLGGDGPETVMVVRPDKKTGTLFVPRPVYEGNWGEVREALQAMLAKRLTGLGCQLQALGVDMAKRSGDIASR